MDMGPFGASRSTSRSGAATRREPAPARTESSNVPQAEPAVQRNVSAQPATHDKKQPKQKKSFKWVIIAVVVLAVAAGGWFAWQKLATADSGIESSKYQAVFFTDGQIYYGKLTVLNDRQYKLTNVFYILSQNENKTANADGDTAETQNNAQLIKMGNELHGPEDAMMINRDHVLFYENLKPDGKVTQTINQYKDNK